MLASLSRFFVLLLCLTALSSATRVLQLPWQREATRVRLSSAHRLEVPADRAILTVHVQSKGASQDVVSEEIRNSQDELMAVLEPLKHLERHWQSGRSHILENEGRDPSRTFDNHPFTASEAPRAEPKVAFVNPDDNLEDGFFHGSSPNLRITVKSLDTSNFRTKATLLGERPIHEARMEYEVEVLNFSILSDVVFKISALPRTSIQNVKWKLSDSATEHATEQCMEGAARLLGLKADKIKQTLGLTALRPVDVVEQWNDRMYSGGHRRDWYDDGANEVVLMSMHDELDEGYTRSRRKNLQPKSLEFEVKLDGEFVAN